MIPRTLFRTVPTVTDDQTEAWWNASVALTPDWDHITYRDPINPHDFPITAPFWGSCTSGAQMAGLIRLEALHKHGGLYLDGDAELLRDPAPLLMTHGFAGWEDRNVIPDAILGFQAGHPVLPVMIAEAIAMLSEGAWQSGPGVTTRNLQGRDDVLLLPPGSLFPYHYSIKRQYRADTADGRARVAQIPHEQPWAYAVHHWRHSWRSAP